ncbi:MAG: hypothetical protein ACRD0K_17295 [Egibacteraceae bacterium]
MFTGARLLASGLFRHTDILSRARSVRLNRRLAQPRQGGRHLRTCHHEFRAAAAGRRVIRQAAGRGQSRR